MKRSFLAVSVLVMGAVVFLSSHLSLNVENGATKKNSPNCYMAIDVGTEPHVIRVSYEVGTEPNVIKINA